MAFNKASGVDGRPPEVYKYLPFIACIFYWSCFMERQMSDSHVEPPGWKILEYIGIPKPDAVGGNTFAKLRWISKICITRSALHHT